MPWQKGKATPGAGRRGYDWEESQLKQMRRILAKDMNIAEKLQNAKELSPLEEKKLQILQARVLKFADKLHVSKTQTDITSAGKPIYFPAEILSKYNLNDNNRTNTSTKDNSTRQS